MPFQNDKEKSYIPILGFNPANRGISTYFHKGTQREEFLLVF